jgi:hypothetical protein
VLRFRLLRPVVVPLAAPAMPKPALQGAAIPPACANPETAPARVARVDLAAIPATWAKLAKVVFAESLATTALGPLRVVARAEAALPKAVVLPTVVEQHRKAEVQHRKAEVQHRKAEVQHRKAAEQQGRVAVL